MANNFQLIHLISQTKPSSSVYSAIRLANRESVAVKVTDTDVLDDYQQVVSEISRTKHLRHKNILNLLSCFVNDSQIWIIYPYMYYGSCRDILDCISQIHVNLRTGGDFSSTANGNGDVNEKELACYNESVDRADEQYYLVFNEQSLKYIAKSILNAIEYLHSKHIIHRCICPDNIFISQSGQVVLSGLKFSISLIEDGLLAKKLHDYPKNINDYLNYLSPELLQQNLIGYNTKSDIYSLGVTLCELANGVNPFIGCEKSQMLLEKLAGFDIGLWDRSILTSEICNIENPRVIKSIQRRNYSEKFRNFVDLCVLRNYQLRPNAQQLLHHSYLKKHKEQHKNYLLTALQTSVVADGLLETQKRIRASLSLHYSSNASSPHRHTSPMAVTYHSNHAAKNTNKNASNNDPDHDPDYDDVPNDESRWNFD